MKKYAHTDFDLTSIQYGGFELIEIKKGWLKKRKVLKTPHRHTFHEMIWIRQGTDHHAVDFKDYCLTEQDLLIIPKGSIHHFEPSDTVSGWKFIFDDSFFSAPQQKMFKDFQMFIPFLGHKMISIRDEDIPILNHSIEVLHKLKGNKQKQTVMMNLISFVNDCFEHHLINNIDNQYIQFLQLLNEEIYNHQEVGYYSGKLNLSNKSLNSIVKQVTGYTTLGYIHLRLINEAKSKLLNTQLKINEIAYSLGFNDALYFSRFFKKKTGNSPEHFRRSALICP